MAKTRLGVMVGGASGALGSTVFSRNRYGTYVRLWAKPTLSTTAYAQAAKNTLAAMSQRWAGLTAIQKLAWETWAQENPVVDRLGDKRVLTGHTAQVQINARLDKIGASLLDLPPVGDPPDSLTSFSFAWTIGAPDTCILTFAATPLPANTHLWVYGCKSGSTGRTYVENWMRQFYISPAAQATGVDIYSEFEARFGDVQAGETVFLRAFVIDDLTGLLSGALDASALAA